MPGKGRGRGWRRGRGRRKWQVLGFIRPCLLILLAGEGDSHGYDMTQRLERFGFLVDELDPSLVYRALADMEAAGLVRSYSTEESLGPPRRMYALTSRGQEQLHHWIEGIRETRADIDRLLEAYQDQVS